ncbi:MAG: hypothetical protein K2P81_06290 [Bacteriovoracaceae bacterium]|nr:hypothetical protein [Bacteriovoracaceae bacterium]
MLIFILLSSMAIAQDCSSPSQDCEEKSSRERDLEKQIEYRQMEVNDAKNFENPTKVMIKEMRLNEEKKELESMSDNEN